MNKAKILLVLLSMVLVLHGCTNTSLVDTFMPVADNNWAYAKSLKTTVEIKDPGQAYRIQFKLRHTSAYRYANLYVWVHLKGNGLKKSTRYQFKVARPDGEWLGKGSGDIFTNSFTLLSNFRFPSAGKYEIEIAQNMRDNPLVGISDVGISIALEN